MTRPTDPGEARARIAGFAHWYHRIEVAPGVVTPGVQDSPAVLTDLDRLGLPAHCSGLRVLDVGTRDGFFAFELERRGGAVTAIDYMLPTRTGFGIAAELLGSSVEYVVENVYELSASRSGTFDLILFLGVLYHLRNPLAALDRLREVSRPGTLLFVETVLLDEQVVLGDGRVDTLRSMAPRLVDLPLVQFYPRRMLAGDGTSKWGPNMAALRAMLEEAQFSVSGCLVARSRGMAAAVATSDADLDFHRRLDAGRGF